MAGRSIARRASAAPDRRLGRPVRRRRRDAGRRRSSRRAATRPRAVRLASVSKPVTALATLVAAEEGVVDLDEPAGPPGATVRHLLAHASGLPFEGETPIAPPGRRRIYSNEGFRVLGEHLEARAEMPFADYVRAAVVEPLGLALDPAGHPGAGMHGSLDDVLAVGRELLAPRLVAAETHAEMTSVQFPGLDGVLPGLRPLQPARLGARRRAQGREGAATGRAARTSPRTFGHFGGSGTFLWVDPELGVACAALTTREFGDWAKEAWPRLSDAVVDELSAARAVSCVVVGEERPQELVERRAVAARDDARRHRRDGRRARRRPSRAPPRRTSRPAGSSRAARASAG